MAGPDWVLSAESCERRMRCSREDRWACASWDDWVGHDGRAPWGEPESEVDRLAYLASMSEAEHRELANIAHGNIDTGYWQGCTTQNGGFEDGEPWSEEERLWRLTAKDFMERYALGAWELTEGMIMYATSDFCRELAWLRGWCPRPPTRHMR